MATVRYDQATRRFAGGDRPAVDALDLDIADGEFLVLVGPSGCGKSTSLRMLAGLEPVTGGRVLIDDRDMARVAPRDRDVAMVFQNYALYPNMTVAQNMGFALRNAGVSKADTRAKVDEAARILHLEDYLDRKPSQLSGGQRQRVAMGRAIVRRPKVFCMDEPLSNLDAKLRVSTRGEIAALQRQLGVTTVYVTHDQVEAMTMGDRVAVLSDGVLQQVDTPRRLYDHPVNTFVAGFVGTPAMNLALVEVADGRISFGSAEVAVPAQLDGRSWITYGIRPEALRRVGPSEPGLDLTVDLVEELGDEAFVYGHTVDGGTVDGHSSSGDRLAVKLGKRHGVEIGSVLRVAPVAEESHAFDADSGERIRG